MKLLSSLTDDGKQQAVIVLDDDTVVNITLEYRDNQKGWFYSLSYPFSGWKVNNRRLVASPNMLQAFKNVIPFGLLCWTSDGYEPVLQNDFVSGRVQLYVLNPSDILLAEAAILNG